MAQWIISKPFGAPQAPQICNFFLTPPKAADPATAIFSSFTAAEGGCLQNGGRRRPKGGTKGAAAPEGERNRAEGGCFASIS